MYYNEERKPWGFCTATPLYVHDPENRYELACWVADAAAKPVLDAKDIVASECYPYGDDQGDHEKAEDRPPGEAPDEDIVEADLEEVSDERMLLMRLVDAVDDLFREINTPSGGEELANLRLAKELLKVRDAFTRYTDREL